MGKIAGITNAEQERAFDLIREPDALYLCVKCSDSKKHSKIVNSIDEACENYEV